MASNPQQGERRVSEYSLEFHPLSVGSGWNEVALKAVFSSGSRPLFLTELVCHVVQQTLDSLIDLAIRLDNLLWNQQSLQESSLSALATMIQTPMEVSNTHMAQSKQEWRHREGRVFTVVGLTIC